MPSRKSSRNHNDYGASLSRRSYPVHGAYAYPMVPAGAGHYGSYNPYGTMGHRNPANYDPYRR